LGARIFCAKVRGVFRKLRNQKTLQTAVCALAIFARRVQNRGHGFTRALQSPPAARGKESMAEKGLRLF
jgi:hypothetical protein